MVSISNLTFDMHQGTFHLSARIQNSKVLPIGLTYVVFKVIQYTLTNVGRHVSEKGRMRYQNKCEYNLNKGSITCWHALSRWYDIDDDGICKPDIT